MLGKVNGCGDAQFVLFAAVHIVPGPGKAVGFAEFHLHKYQIVLIFRDQVDLAEAAAEASGYNGVLFLPQVLCRQCFSPGTAEVIPSHKISSGKSYDGWGWGPGSAGPHSEP